MNGKSILWLMTIVMLLCFSLTWGCGDDDDDDDSGSGDDDDDDTTGDDDDDDSVSAEEFCQKVSDCGDDIDAYQLDDSCDAAAAEMDSTTLACASNGSCGDFASCVEAAGGWGLWDMTLIKHVFTLSSTEISFYQPWGLGTPRVSPKELAKVAYQYYAQPDCEQGSAAIWTSIDNGPWEQAGALAPSAPCVVSGDNYFEAFNLDTTILTEGGHQIESIFVNAGGFESNVISTLFMVDDYIGANGSTMADFTLPGINPPTKEGKSVETLTDISLSQFTGQVTLINSSTIWCPSCNDEADELQSIYEDYNAKTANSFTVLQLLSQNGNYQSPQTPNLAELQDWADRNGDTVRDLLFPILIDAGATVADPFNINLYIPFNFILDQNGVCVYKMIGWYKPYIEDVLDDLLGL